ncbi:MAG: transcriptional regulator [Candidatus Jorgensenbacteria bacterium GW2011_GWA1_48_13]|uniref:Transcriptional regulator n=3 Tax=Candidatus Joergenseniibacteriota TaxID=1752739 RepID=A0A0G1W950_9BACT|nr:MAG: transcriptional regulator [Candidatus Jorgensenbacteria bacterium GW2011_GWA1_48_13]KKW15303.1 MAG: transcriptional regulator [Candidatus Jorgensenbacteria bacterium GW2011_GWB1_50_10]
MAGHSHWKQIKERKGKADERRGAEFSKLLRAVTVQAKQEKNPDFNPGLRAAVERARTGGVPRENIERAIEKAASGEGTTEEIILEAYGPGGTALVIQALTDNKNRTIQEIKNILKDGGGRLAEPKSVVWAFITEGGEWKPKFPGAFSDENRIKSQALAESLENHDDVQGVYRNF